MTPPARHECAREHEVLDLVAIGQWPGRADADLAAHARQCAVCADLAAAALAIVELRDQTTLRVPDASRVWHRAQIRARAEAARRAGVPVTLAVCTAAAVVASASVACWNAGSLWLRGWWDRIVELAPDLTLTLPTPSMTGIISAPGMPVVALGAVAALLVVPLAFYLAKLADR